MYEFCYEYDEESPQYWKEDSIYITTESMVLLQNNIDMVIKNFHYYGTQNVKTDEWKSIEKLCLIENEEQKKFFKQIDEWIEQKCKKSQSFWILGV